MLPFLTIDQTQFIIAYEFFALFIRWFWNTIYALVDAFSFDIDSDIIVYFKCNLHYDVQSFKSFNSFASLLCAEQLNNNSKCDVMDVQWFGRRKKKHRSEIDYGMRATASSSPLLPPPQK